jgi:lysozyme family protein
MTLEEMQAITLDAWKENWPKEYRKLGKKAPEWAKACAKLTRMEMDALKLIGMDEAEAWAEARTLFCLKRPKV